MAQFTVYRSTDANAPTLTGQVDKLCALLRACLVDGYGAKAGAGWSVEFDGTNKTVFRQGAAADGAIQAYFRVLDDGSVSNAQQAICTGYESMSDIDTGTNPIGTFYWRKSALPDATQRVWIVVADARTFYLFVTTGDATTGMTSNYFGDFYSYVTADPYRIIHGGNPTSQSQHYNYAFLFGSAAAGGGLGKAVARNYLGVPGSYPAQLCQISGLVSGSNGYVKFPNPADGRIIIAPYLVIDSTTESEAVIHGHLRGVYLTAHYATSAPDGTTFSGTGDFAGKSFCVWQLKWGTSSSSYQSPAAFETSNTVDTN